MCMCCKEKEGRSSQQCIVLILCRLIYPGYKSFYMFATSSHRIKNLTALRELSATTAPSGDYVILTKAAVVAESSVSAVKFFILCDEVTNI